MLNHPLRTIVLTAVLALVPAASASAKTETLRFFSHVDKLQLTHADGTVVDNPTGPPVAGDRLDVYSSDFAGDHKRHAKKPIASDHTVCIFGSSPEPDCITHVALGSSLLIFDGDSLIGGTGKYLHATGKVISNETVGDSNDSDVVAKIKVR
jgi:hypothetical protein